MSYTNKQLTQMAQINPKELVRILTSPNADIRMLTAGAEILGLEVKDELLVAPTLRLLLKHMNALVRESACIGVSAFYVSQHPPQDILDRIKAMSSSDPSTIIRDYSKTLLKDFDV